MLQARMAEDLMDVIVNVYGAEGIVTQAHAMMAGSSGTGAAVQVSGVLLRGITGCTLVISTF